MSTAPATPPVAPAGTPTPASTPTVQGNRWTSDELLRGAKETSILHGDQLYWLRLTASGKLILVK